MPSRHHNPERQAWKGRSHKRGGARIAALAEKQAAEVARLEAELALFVADGDEYHAEGVRDDLLAATSLARLLHKA